MPTRVAAEGQVEDDYPSVLLAGEVLARGQGNFMRQLTGAWEGSSSKRCCRCTNCPRRNGHSRTEARTFTQAVASRGLVWRRRDAAAAHPAGCERRVGWANPSPLRWAECRRGAVQVVVVVVKHCCAQSSASGSSQARHEPWEGGECREASGRVSA